MKDEKNVRKRRAAGSRWLPVAVLLAALLLVLSVPFGGKPVYAVNLDESCSVEVAPGGVTMAEDLSSANVVIDLYRVADAVAVPGYDTYSWQINDAFNDGGIEIAADIDNAGWQAAAQAAAKVVLGTAPEGASAWDPSDSVAKIDAGLVSSGNEVNTPITGLKAGLYLVIARGSNVTDYAASGTEESTTVTIANSRTFAYKFNPELISLPTKGTDPATGEVNTANTGDWVYDAAITLKPSQEVRTGSLEITKTLETYAQREKTTDAGTREIKDPATFIFEVSVFESQSADASIVYHDYVSIVFDSYGSKSALIENLPVDGYAVVREVYSGKIYTTDTEKNAVIKAGTDDPAKVSFVNDYDNENGGGGSVTNNFTLNQSEWVWRQVTDNSTSGTVIQGTE